MSEMLSAAQGALSDGYVRVEEAGLVGMITLRLNGDDSDGLAALSGAFGAEIPQMRRMTRGEAANLLWMSPDEYLIVCEHSEADGLVSKLSEVLADYHHLVVNVSDARAVFEIRGESGAIRDALAKLTPADLRLASLGVGEVRRTRLAQIPAAIWFEEDGLAKIVCFRSVAQYAFDILANASTEGSRVGFF